MSIAADGHELNVAAGVLVDASGRVLIARRGVDKHMGGAWEFPGGKIVAGETPLQGLVRELREELGITVLGARHLVRYSHQYSEYLVHLYVWKVLDWSGEAVGLENQPLRWVLPENLLEAGLLAADERIVNLLQQPAEVNTVKYFKRCDSYLY